eukprot:CAMPEP_0181168778 /NCGR_PEP_ID=MMETSP1096-20121128/459_1 /TAXON_ID=156174 ORGANISM="Chrysochromulina ericina, Strain CCMP281" /NCGR_SAMPLE_ID=MMETSP1096 /ASSEMBLY_ACC=CAM_ASM_000453 /LENGTH=283 /DNA_ID=CAMNT_0023256185 /DNA_START=595 /DNA_END=1447 /DNA_ORIENTATION=+
MDMRHQVGRDYSNRGAVCDVLRLRQPSSWPLELEQTAAAAAYSEIMGVYAEEVAALEARLRTVKAGCFGPVREVSANLTTQEDVYPLAANRMFYKLLEGFFVLKRHDYMLYMEVDTVPVRRLWLDAISMLIPPFSEPFWLKGSAPRNDVGRDNLHINGNALYNLRDTDLLRLYRQAERMDPYCAFDIALSSLSVQLGRSMPWKCKGRGYPSHLAHHFVFTPAIANHYNAPIPVSIVREKYPCAVLMHANRSSLRRSGLDMPLQRLRPCASSPAQHLAHAINTQ